MSKSFTFQELVELKQLRFGDGYRTKKSEHGKPGLPILRVAEVLDGKINPQFSDYVSNEYRSSMGDKTSQPGDIVLTTKGTVGRVAIIPDNATEFVYSPQVCYFRILNHNSLIPRYLYYWFRSEQFWTQAIQVKSQTDMADYINLADIRRLKIEIPSIDKQKAITEVLGALDDKIAVNDRIAATTRHLALAWFSTALENEAQDIELSEVTSILTRGVTPKYSEDSTALTVLNQKCVRDGRVNLTPARKTLREKVKSPKFLQQHDVLVNSTGVGTLGRVAIWDRDDEATVDSHVTIVRFDTEKVDPLCAGMAMLRAQPDIELLGEGSTGQTELSRKQLSAFRITLPSNGAMRELRPRLDGLEARGKAALEESNALAALRDTLLPKLMSGEIRVRDAEKVVEDAV